MLWQKIRITEEDRAHKHLLLDVVRVPWKTYREVKHGLSYNWYAVCSGTVFFLISACSDCSFNWIMLFQVPFLLYFHASGVIFICREQWNLCCNPHGSMRNPILTWLTFFGIRLCAGVQPFLVLDTEFAFLHVCNLGKLVIQLVPLT